MMTLHDKYLFKPNGYMSYLIAYVLKRTSYRMTYQFWNIAIFMEQLYLNSPVLCKL